MLTLLEAAESESLQQPTPLEDKPTPLEDKPTPLGDKPTLLGDKPTLLEDKPTPPEETKELLMPTLLHLLLDHTPLEDTLPEEVE